MKYLPAMIIFSCLLVACEEKSHQSFQAIPESFSQSLSSRDESRGSSAEAIKRDGKYYVVVDGKEYGGPYDLLGELVWSPDHQSLAYITQKDGKQYVIQDKKVVSPYDPRDRDGPYAPFFSPDGKTLIYIGGRRIGGDEGEERYKDFIVVNGQKGKEYDAIWGEIYFSPDSKKVAYVAEKDGQILAVVDGKELPILSEKGEEARLYGIGLYEGGFAGIVFSPDGRKAAYPIVKKVGKEFKQAIVLNGKAGPFYERINNLVVDSKNQKLHYEAVLKNKVSVVEVQF